MPEPDFEKMAKELLGVIWDTESYDTKLRVTIAALRAAATVPDGFVRQGTTDMPLHSTYVQMDTVRSCPDLLESYAPIARRHYVVNEPAAEAARGEPKP